METKEVVCVPETGTTKRELIFNSMTIAEREKRRQWLKGWASQPLFLALMKKAARENRIAMTDVYLQDSVAVRYCDDHTIVSLDWIGWRRITDLREHVRLYYKAIRD